MKHRNALAAMVLCMMMPALALASDSDGQAKHIVDLEQQFLSAGSTEQRMQSVQELRTLGSSVSGQDAEAFHAAISEMLPAAVTASEADALLSIAASTPPEQMADAAKLPSDSQYLVDPRQAARQATHPHGDVEALADIRIDHLGKDSLGHDGLAEAHVQQVWRINTVRGARTFSPRALMYSGIDERLELVSARVIKSNGDTLEADVSPDQPVVERSSSMYFDARSRELRFPELRPGDLAEIEYRLLPARQVNPWNGYYAHVDWLRDSLSTRLWRRVLVAPSSLTLYPIEHGLKPAELRNEGGQTTRIWEARGIDPQSLLPGADQAYLHVSTIGSLEDFGRWYDSLLEPSLKLEGKLAELADEIRARDLTPEQKVKAVYEAVQRRTYYTAFEFGVHSYEPYAVSTVDRRGFGDCKDKAAMLVALLRAVGIQAEFAMVRTRFEAPLASEAYSVQLFDHAMAYVPELNLYLDGTAAGITPGQLPQKDRGALALTVDAQGRATRRLVPFSQPAFGGPSNVVQASVTNAAGVTSVAQTGPEAEALAALSHR